MERSSVANKKFVAVEEDAVVRMGPEILHNEQNLEEAGVESGATLTISIDSETVKEKVTAAKKKAVEHHIMATGQMMGGACDAQHLEGGHFHPGKLFCRGYWEGGWFEDLDSKEMYWQSQQWVKDSHQVRYEKSGEFRWSYAPGRHETYLSEYDDQFWSFCGSRHNINPHTRGCRLQQDFY